MQGKLNFGGACLIAPHPNSQPQEALQFLNADFFLCLEKKNACVMTDPRLAWLAGAINILQSLAVPLEEILHILTPSHTATCQGSKDCVARAAFVTTVQTPPSVRSSTKTC